MLARSYRMSSRTLAPLLASLVALASLACSGESDSADDDDDSGGSSTGGTSGSGGSGTGGSSGTGTGGASGSGGTPAYCDAAFMPTDPTAVIDTLEDGNSLIATVSDRNGSWWVTSDGTEGTIAPMSGAAPPPERILGKRCDSEYGIRVTGQGFTQWGANVSIGFRYEGMELPIDASDFSGVMFWARVGETHNSPVRVQLQDTNTYPNGGVCNPDPASGTEQCYDGWGTTLTPLDTEWRLYKIPFSRIAQQNFGYAGEALDTAALYTLEWVVQQNTVFDLWLDDVWFYE